MFIRLTDTIAVAGQLQPADLAAAAAQGFATVVNNRPDGEEWGQPTGAAMRLAAAAAQLDYVEIPVDHAGLGMAQVEAMAAVLAATSQPVIAFCRSGTRSTHLWALAAAHAGDDADAIITAAERGGFDLRALRPALLRLAAAG